MTDEKIQIDVTEYCTVAPMRDGRWGVIVNGWHEPNPKGGVKPGFTVTRFDNEYEAQTWAQAKRAGKADNSGRSFEMVYDEDFDNWWQDIEHLAYFLDGEPAEDRLKRIQEFLDGEQAQRNSGAWQPDEDSSYEWFRRYAVLHLLHIWLTGPLERETYRNGFLQLMSRVRLGEQGEGDHDEGRRDEPKGEKSN